MTDTSSIERQFVVKMGHCIRTHNTIHSTDPFITDDLREKRKTELLEYGKERTELEKQIEEKYQLDNHVCKRIITDLYKAMDEADKGFVMGQGSPMWQRLDEFITKFTDAIKSAKEAQS